MADELSDPDADDMQTDAEQSTIPTEAKGSKTTSDGAVVCKELRQSTCKSLVRNGARTVRDGADHSEKANRCIVEGGKCVGYYAVLIDYDEATDTFCVGWQQRVPAAQVDEIALLDALSQIIALLQYAARIMTQKSAKLHLF